MTTITGTLGKTMTVLEAVALAGRPLRFTDVLALLPQSRGTLHRHLSHLVEEGLLDLDSDLLYRPGLRLLKLASAAWSSHDMRSVAEPFLRQLHDETGETVHLGQILKGEIIYLDKVEGRQSVRMHSQVGKVSPLYCTGVGKAALSALPEVELQSLLEAMQFHAFTASTHRDQTALLADIAEIRRTGIAFDDEEHEAGICCVAAPVATANGSFIGGLSISGPAFRLTREKLQAFAPSVRQAADRITEAFAYRLGPKAS